MIFPSLIAGDASLSAIGLFIYVRTQCAHCFSAIFVIAVIALTFGVNWSIGVATETGSDFEGGFLSSFLAGSQVGLSSHGSFDHLGVSFKSER